MLAGELAEVLCGALSKVRTNGTRGLSFVPNGNAIIVTNRETGEEFELLVKNTNLPAASIRRARGQS